MIIFYHQTKTSINFWWCRRGLNFRSLIQVSKTLPVKLTRTHFFLLTYTLNAHKINDLYMKKKVNIKRKNKRDNNKLKSIYTFFFNERGPSPKIY